MTKLIVTGFDDRNAAYLARAALARLQEQLGMATQDVAIVLRGADGQVSVEQALIRGAGKNEPSAFLETSADLLFAPQSSAGTTAETTLEKYATLGIEPTITSRAVNQLRLCKSALLVRTKTTEQREKVVGLLRGFDGQLVQVPLET